MKQISFRCYRSCNSFELADMNLLQAGLHLLEKFIMLMYIYKKKSMKVRKFITIIKWFSPFSHLLMKIFTSSKLGFRDEQVLELQKSNSSAKTGVLPTYLNKYLYLCTQNRNTGIPDHSYQWNLIACQAAQTDYIWAFWN